MDLEEELRVEYKRLERHAHFLEKRYSLHVARDLASSLRNWLQLAALIDDHYKRKGVDLVFTHYENPRQLKKMMSKQNFEYLPLPGSAKSANMQVASVMFFNKAMSQEDVKKLYESTKSSKSVPRKMNFRQWLDAQVYQFDTGEGKRAVSRAEFIDRGANLLGASHPMAVGKTVEHEHWADDYIINLMSSTVSIWPVPYAILMETAQEIVRVFSELKQKMR